MKNIKHKGILFNKKPITFFGINFLFLNIVYGVIKEKRTLELLWGVYCFLFYRPGKILNKIQNNSIFLKNNYYLFKKSNLNILCREENVYKSKNFSIYAEYGQPGARIVFDYIDNFIIYNPYKLDKNVYHIHCICHIDEDLFYITVGDTAKYLDIIKINKYECKIISRISNKLAGYTAIIKVSRDFWAGTDFSHRPNYLINLANGEKYFYPSSAYIEYTLSLTNIHNNRIQIKTKRLGKPKGSLIIFNIKTKKFEILQNIIYSKAPSILSIE